MYRLKYGKSPYGEYILYRRNQVVKIHIIKQGDTLYHLAQKYHVTVAELVNANSGIDPNNLQIGMKIKIPSSSSGHHSGSSHHHIIHQHVVKSGDTMWKLSQEWGVPLSALTAANQHIKNPNVLMVGEIINIPKTTSASAPAVSTSTVSAQAVNIPSLFNPEHAQSLPSVGSVIEHLLPGFHIHTVVAGDTLYNIAEQNGITLEYLMALNPGLGDASNLQIGTKILVPKGSSHEVTQTYTIKPGDSLWKLAQQWNVSLDALVAANGQLSNPDQLTPGQVINVPKNLATGTTAQSVGHPTVMAASTGKKNTGVIGKSNTNIKGTAVAPINVQYTPKETPKVTPHAATKVEPLTTKVAPLATKVEPLTTKVAPLATKVEAQSNKVAPLATKVEAQSNKVAPLATKVEAQSNKVAPLATKVQSVANSNAVAPLATKVQPVANSNAVAPLATKVQSVANSNAVAPLATKVQSVANSNAVAPLATKVQSVANSNAVAPLATKVQSVANSNAVAPLANSNAVAPLATKVQSMANSNTYYQNTTPYSNAVAPMANSNAVAPLANSNAIAPLSTTKVQSLANTNAYYQNTAPYSNAVAPLASNSNALYQNTMAYANNVAPTAYVAPMAYEAPVANKMAPMANKVAPMANKVAPMAYEAPVANKMAQMANKVAPMANKVAPMAYEAPVANKMAPMANKVAPMAYEAPVANKMAPMANKYAGYKPLPSDLEYQSYASNSNMLYQYQAPNAVAYTSANQKPSVYPTSYQQPAPYYYNGCGCPTYPAQANWGFVQPMNMNGNAAANTINAQSAMYPPMNIAGNTNAYYSPYQADCGCGGTQANKFEPMNQAAAKVSPAATSKIKRGGKKVNIQSTKKSSKKTTGRKPWLNI